MQQLRHLLQAKRRRRVGSSNEKWVKLHEQLAREVNAADDGKGYDVLFYGDSILESTRWGPCCMHCSSCSLTPAMHRCRLIARG